MTSQNNAIVDGPVVTVPSAGHPVPRQSEPLTDVAAAMVGALFNPADRLEVIRLSNEAVAVTPYLDGDELDTVICQVTQP